jgi:hypothetical protein
MPLTGEPIDDPSEIPDRPALAVKIDNASAGRPQSGLNEADIVIEEIINDTSTRLAASSTARESIRSARSGRAGTPTSCCSRRSTSRCTCGAAATPASPTTSSGRSSPTSSFLKTPGTTGARGAGADQPLHLDRGDVGADPGGLRGRPPVVLPYLRPGDRAQGDPATVIDVTMDGNRVRWEYNPEDGLYYRWQNGDEHLTENSGQVSTKNVVVMAANYLQSPIDADTPDAQMLGSAPVYIFTGGTVRVGIWLRFESTDRADGENPEFFDNLDDLNAHRPGAGPDLARDPEEPRRRAQLVRMIRATSSGCENISQWLAVELGVVPRRVVAGAGGVSGEASGLVAGREHVRRDAHRRGVSRHRRHERRERLRPDALEEPGDTIGPADLAGSGSYR